MKKPAAHVRNLVRAAILAGVASSMVACASPADPAISCIDHDSSFAARKERMVDSDVFGAYEVLECVSGSDEQNMHEEACALAVKAGDEPQPPVGWERKPMTFAPIMVRKLADKRDVHIAILYSLGEARQFYADDDLSRAVLYQRVTSCSGT